MYIQMVSLNCQTDETNIHQGRDLWISMCRNLLSRLPKVKGSAHCGRHHSLGWDPELLKEKTEDKHTSL